MHQLSPRSICKSHVPWNGQGAYGTRRISAAQRGAKKWWYTQGKEGATATAVDEACGRMHLLRCAAWRRHGCCTLAAAEACIYMTSFAHDAADMQLAYAQLALIANERQGALTTWP